MVTQDNLYKINLEMELTENPLEDKVRKIHTIMEISETRRKTFHRPLEESKRDSLALTEVGDLGRAILTRLFQIDGIIKVTIEPYKLAIAIAEMFFWPNMEAKVKSTILNVITEFVEEDEMEKRVIATGRALKKAIFN